MAEVVGAIAVGLSLLYLAYEIRTNTKVLKANSAKETQLQWAVVNETLWQSPDRMVIARAFDPQESTAAFSVEENRLSSGSRELCFSDSNPSFSNIRPGFSK